MNGVGAPAGILGLGPVDQIAFAVRDLDRVLPVYEAMFGPFEVRKRVMPQSTFQDTVVQPTIKIAYGRSGDLSVEIIEVISGASTVLDHLDRHGDGLHHIRFIVTDLPQRRAVLEEQGFETLMAGANALGAYAYLQAPDLMGHTVIELLERFDAPPE